MFVVGLIWVGFVIIFLLDCIGIVNDVFKKNGFWSCFLKYFINFIKNFCNKNLIILVIDECKL